MRIIAPLIALVLAGCGGDRLTGTKCETVSAIVSNPAATRDQVATAMEWAVTTAASALGLRGGGQKGRLE